MTAEVFLDTNVLVYAIDSRVVAKMDRAQQVLARIVGRGVISTQVAAEYYTTITRKARVPFAISSAVAELKLQLEFWRVVGVTSDIVLRAADIAAKSQLNYWDAQIVAAASVSDVKTLLSEDMQHGAVIRGVRILNPFRDDFQMDWLA
jgi:predicted nucleic acid-binding protein